MCFGAGVAAFMLGQDEVAQARFECALARNPASVPAATWLADLHYRAGRLADAIAVYEALGRHSSKAAELQQQIDLLRKEDALQRRFATVRNDHFIAYFEAAGDAPLAKEVVDRLEAAYSRIGKALGTHPTQPITVVLYTREQFDDITQLSAWSVAAYDGRIRIPLGLTLAQPAELDRLLSHEFVHAVVTKLGGRAVPAWVNEGLATVLEPAGSKDVEAVLDRANDGPALSKLHRSFVGLSVRDAEVAYASAARAVRRLIEQHGTSAVVALLKDLSQGAPFDDAFQKRTAMRYEDFEALVARK
jgi:tetratricopeptide (TPR) repeat protein